ncbi:hypothetical protein LUZ60_015394 [Juncus effusus]|nr:hypothetical protein LUZ60_015394 [Juncus effusus]
MALGDLMASRLSQSPSPAVVTVAEPPAAVIAAGEDELETSMAYLPHTVVICESRHEGFEDGNQIQSGPSDGGFVSKWRPKDRMKTGCVALVLCLNISVDPPDVIKISPCARKECWIDPFAMAPPKALDSIGKALHEQYERWQPKARYKLQLDPTVDEIKKLCATCRKYARSERVLFHYNGHGVPKPTANGEVWVFNKSYTQYIPLPITDLDSWLKTPSIYVFDCSAAGLILNAFIERLGLDSSSSSTSSPKDCIILAACEANETLPQSAEFPADVFTACLTTPIKMALHWFCGRSLLRDSLDHSLIDRIPGRQNDRKTLLGELNWIFTAITDTIAWNVLPHELFQRLFRQDLLVASLFRNFLLAERIMRAANCSPVSYPVLPPTHQHHMWDAWDMAAENCLAKLPQLIADPNSEFQPSPFFTEQLTAFEVWLDHGSENKKPPEQLPIVLQVLLSQSHRFRALVLLGRFLDMGSWAVDLALSVGIFPYVLKLLQTTALELRQILVFIWTKILALDKSCQVDLVKDMGHLYFIRFLDASDAYPEQRAMAAFVLAVILDGHRKGQEACLQTSLMEICLRQLQGERGEPLLMQWLCLCLGKVWEDFPEAQVVGVQMDAVGGLVPLLVEPQPEVRASAVFALGTLLDVQNFSFRDEDGDDDEKLRAEVNIVKSLFQAVSDGSPLVRAEVVAALARFALGHNRHLKSITSEYWKTTTQTHPPSSSSTNRLTTPPSLSNLTSFIQSTPTPLSGPVLRIGSDSSSRGISIINNSINNNINSSPHSDSSSQHSDPGLLRDVTANNTANNTNNVNIGSNGGMSYHSRSSSRSNNNIDNPVYQQFILTMLGMARDPSPRVAGHARRTLSIIGIDSVVLRGTRFGGVLHAGESSAPTSSGNLTFARSNSWLDMNAGNLSMNFRTPPVSPPQQSYLSGLRRVCSLEFRPHPQSSPPQPSPPQPSQSVHSSRSNSEATTTNQILPESNVYNWSCGHFSRPLLTGSDENEEGAVRREERERCVMDCVKRCQHSCASKLNNQIASWDTRFETGTKATLLLPFSPVVVAADENEQIRVWNYEDATVLNSFDNHQDSSEKGISKLCLVNELDDNLLLAASSDGNVRIWKNFTVKGKQKLATAFSSVPGPQRPSIRNAIVDWQQQSGYLYAAGGDLSSIHIWDLEKEQLLSSIPSSCPDSTISVLSASQVHGGQFAAGFTDGSLRIFDIRSSDMPVCMARPHTQGVERVVGIGFQPGIDPSKIVSASQAGDIQFLDARMTPSLPYLTIDAHRGSLTALAVHRHAPVIVSGSAKQLVKVFSLQGEQLGIIRYYPTFMAQRIGSVTCLAFHPYRVLLAAGAADALVSIYADDGYQVR